MWTAPAGSTTWRVFAFWESYTNQRSRAGGVNATEFIENGSWIVDHFSRNGGKRTTDFLDEHAITGTETQILLNSVGDYGTLCLMICCPSLDKQRNMGRQHGDASISLLDAWLPTAVRASA